MRRVFMSVLLLKRSPRADFISPEGVNKRPSYFYSRTFLIFSSPTKKSLRIKGPVLLNIMYFVLSTFIDSLFSSQYSNNTFNKSCLFLRQKNNIIWPYDRIYFCVLVRMQTIIVPLPFRNVGYEYVEKQWAQYTSLYHTFMDLDFLRYFILYSYTALSFSYGLNMIL